MANTKQEGKCRKPYGLNKTLNANVLQINELILVTRIDPQRSYVLIPPLTSHSILFIPNSEEVHPSNGVSGNTYERRRKREALELRALVFTEREGWVKVKRD